jgi:hypothetical protein
MLLWLGKKSFRQLSRFQAKAPSPAIRWFFDEEGAVDDCLINEPGLPSSALT